MERFDEAFFGDSEDMAFAMMDRNLLDMFIAQGLKEEARQMIDEADPERNVSPPPLLPLDDDRSGWSSEKDEDTMPGLVEWRHAQ